MENSLLQQNASFFFTFLLCLMITSCSSSRTKAEGEILLSEVIYEEHGIYYELSAPNTKKRCTGSFRFYYTTGVVKGAVNILDGFPDGAWKYYHRNGRRDYTLFFDKGKLIKREDYDNE